MNRERVEYCIGLMQKAQSLDMNFFQKKFSLLPYGQGGRLRTVRSIEELHKCGNSACFAGYVALSEKFQEDGGLCDYNEGYPIWREPDNKIYIQELGLRSLNG